MSLANYTDVKTALGDWLHRADITSQCDDFIDLFESQFNAEMRVRQMEVETVISSTSGYLLHPSNWLGWKNIKGTSSGETYMPQPVSDETMIRETSGESSGTARYYKVTGSKTYLKPSPGDATNFTVTYWEGVALASTNWLLNAYPGAYLYGSLLQAHAYIIADERVPLWSAAYDSIKASIKRNSELSEWSGQVLQMKPDRVI
jgi:hypothetical protein